MVQWAWMALERLLKLPIIVSRNRNPIGLPSGRYKRLHYYLGNTACERVQAEIPTGGKDFALEYYSDALRDELGVLLDLEYVPTISRADIFPDLCAGMRVTRRNLRCGLRLELANSSRMQLEPD